ncbi:MAG: thioredoxin family protein [Desulfurococcus sp.]|uniref:thioredoxin family protein n=1 Tax=Desulfurococcus sp. TaxID=51678 RepID=UPI0031629799
MPGKSTSKNKGRTDKGNVIFLLIPVVVFIAAIAILLLWNQPGGGSGNIAFYLGTSKYMDIDITSSEWENIYNNLTQIVELNESTRIVMFGLTTCPHCHAQQEFFNTEMPGKALYLWIDTDKRVESLFSQLTNLEISKGVPPQYVLGVPHILVLDKNGGLVAVVIGEAEDKGFWDRLLTS